MMMLAHAAVGGVVGKHLSSPFLAFGVGVMAHLLLDKVPHFWPKGQRLNKLMFALDLLLSFWFIYFLYLQPFSNKDSVLAGALAGISVDIVLVLILPLYRSKFGRWHAGRQRHLANPLLLSFDILVFLLASFFLAGPR